MTRIPKACAQLLVAAGAAGIVLISPRLTSQVAAQEGGPECPSGFVWQRMSGVGCVQENCFDVANAKLSYTSSCICLDGYKPCYAPVDTAGVACDPFCPASRLIACIAPDALCPAEPAGAEPAGPVPDNGAAPEAPASGGRDITVSVPNLVKDLEDFLAGEGVSSPTAKEAAAGDAALAALIGAWVLVNAASGVNVADLLRAVQTWRRGPSTAQAAGTATAAKPTAAARTPAPPTGAKQAASPAIPLRTSGTLPGQKPAGAQPTPGPDAGAKPPTTAAQKTSPQAGQGKPDGTPEVTPEKLQLLQLRFRQVVAEKIKEGYYVRNPDFVRKAWSWSVGLATDPLSGHKPGQCGEFAEWGRQWSKGFVRELFGPSAIVDYITVDEPSTRVQTGFEDRIDALYTANHAATRVTLPNGDSYILDYWSAVNDQQVKWGTDIAYQQIFDEPAPRHPIQLIPEKAWIKTWREKIGWDDSEVSNMSYAQQQLKQCIRQHGSEAEGIQAWRDMKLRGVPDHQMETVINSWKKNGVWWER